MTERIVISRGVGIRNGCLIDTAFCGGKDEKVLKLNGGGGCKNMNILNVTKLYSSQWLILCYVNITSIF